MTSKRFFIHNNIIKNILTITCLYFTSYNFAIAATVQNKASKFDDILDEVGTNSESGQSSDMAEKIRAQRAALDSTASNTVAKSNTTNSSKCDKDLRVCMQKKCGDDFTKCATDTATTFGDKIDSCRKDTTCTAHEYTLFSQEILEDRNQNVKLSSYNAIINCGNNYNDCIFQECGTFLDKCLSKKQEDAAIAKCESIAKKCIKQDSALSSHTRQVISEYRVDAEKQISVDEQRLYALRDEMRNQCSILGAMFDETSLDCVFSINFFAGDDTKTPKASKKLYAGNTFTCSPEWFGIDITTFKENAYRETRAQTAASSAMLGSGVGTAVGTITSGAIDRAVDTQKAKKELKTAETAEEKAQKKEDRKENKAMRKARQKEDAAVIAKGAEVTASATHDAIYGEE